MPFPKTNSSYGRLATPEPFETPYSRAARAWDDRIGSARVQARNWRYVAFASLLAALLLGGGLIYSSARTQVETYVVEIDEAGMPGRITLASEPYRPDAAQTGYFVGEVVRLVRERPIDPVVMRRRWTRAYHFLAGDAVRTMNQYAAQDTGLRVVAGGRSARTVEITSIVQQAEQTYQVRWLETAYAGGVVRQREQWTGLFHVAWIPPSDEEDAFRNPLGVYVNDFHWSREFTAPVQTRPTATPPPNEPAPAAAEETRP